MTSFEDRLVRFQKTVRYSLYDSPFSPRLQENAVPPPRPYRQKTPAGPAGVFWVCVLCVCKGVGEGLVGVSVMLEVRSALPCFHVYITL